MGVFISLLFLNKTREALKTYSTEEIKKFIANNRVDKFYNDRSWRRRAEEIKLKQNNECQFCKARGKVGPAEIVHHVKHLRQYPELAYSEYYIDENGQRQRQLVACCFNCHEKEHNRIGRKKDKFTNIERW